MSVPANPPCRVSVIVPAYQAGPTLAATLASARAQTERAIEILVIDDGSTDATGAVARAAAAEDGRVRVIVQANAGVATARNAGLAAARGRWVAPLDADDLWHPLKLARQLAAAEAARHPPALVYSWSRGIDPEDRVLGDLGRPTFRGDVLAPLIASNFLNSASLPLLDRAAVERAGGFDASLQARGAQGAEDLQLWLALAEAHPAEVAPGFLVGYRMLPGSMSQAPARMRRSLEMVLEALERRRPDVPPPLMRLGRMNYDLYAAALSLSGGDRRGFLGWLGGELEREPLEGMRLLACQAALRTARATGRVRAGAGPRFLDLAPDAAFDGAAATRLERRRQAAARRAAGDWRTAPEGAGAAWREAGA